MTPPAPPLKRGGELVLWLRREGDLVLRLIRKRFLTSVPRFSGITNLPPCFSGGAGGVILLITALISFAQEPQPPDSLRSIPSDTLSADSAVTTARKDDGVDTVVHYEANQIDFDVISRVTVLLGNARIEYKDMTLEAGRIEVNWDKQILRATAISDSIYKDSTSTFPDSVVLLGKPHFTQGVDDFYGDEIAYNMKTKIGRVIGGSTEYEQGFYYGEQFNRIADDVITARGGAFTSCDADTPHYHFAARDLKIIVGKRVLARPVFLFFDDVPVLAAPYGIFPQQKGRTSGIIVPTFGESSGQGRFLRDVGYYWAPSQYMDVISTIDYFERFGVLGRGEYRYAKRYWLTGSARYAFDTQRQGEQQHRDYSLAWAHNQTVNENTRLAVNGSYVSSERFYEDVGSIQDQLNQSVRSNATLSKSWYNSPWTFGANLGYEQNIRQETWNASLPSFTLNHKSGLLFPPPKPPKGIRNAAVPRENEPPWYRAFQWSYSVNYQNSLSLPHQFKEEGLRPAYTDSAGTRYPQQSIRGSDSLSIFQRDGFAHSGGISATARLFKYFNLNPRINSRHVWTRRTVHYEAVNDSLLDRQDAGGFFTRTTFDVGTSLNTKLYGTSVRPFGIGASFRHVMTPGVSFTYRPDFQDKKWGYYETVTLPDGRSLTYDRFSSTEMSANVGGTPVGMSQSIGIGLDQLFQMKTGDAEEGTEKKLDLLSVGSQTGLDLKRDSLKWNDLSTSLRTSVPTSIFGSIQGLAVDASMTHSPYARVGGQRVNTFFWEREDAAWYAPLELLNAALNVGFSVRAESVKQLLFLDRAQELPEDTSLAADTSALLLNTTVVPELGRNVPPSPAERQGIENRNELFDMPVSLRFNFRRSRDYVSGSSTSAMGANAQFSITPRWEMSFDYVLDLDRKIARNASVSIGRDLHCWEASLIWSPLGYRPGYFLRIGLKASQLQDVKIERHRGAGLRGYP